MAFISVMRPDNTAVSVNPNHVVKLTPVPTSGPSMGPFTERTRIHFKDSRHQDVKELLADVETALNAAQ